MSHTDRDRTAPVAAPVAAPDAVEAFIERWTDTGGKERANYQLFLTELCRLLDLPGPEPATEDDKADAYVFERRVDIAWPDGTTTRGYIDLYRRGHFVLEAKRVSQEVESSRWDKAMLRAANQADTYIRALPADEGRPPFLLTCDVGKTIEVYAEFTRSGATYVPFPDPRSHRIHLDDLRDPAIQQRLVAIWTDPDALDPSRRAARVTRELSRTLASLARSLEKDGYKVERVAHFVKRCLFTMFCEDVDLLPRGQFTELLKKMKATPRHFPQAIASLWQTMDTGGYSPILNEELLRFNGNLFKDLDPIPLNADQIQLLIDAGLHDWSEVEPAIFGTLLERALDPEERHQLGAHYTPRAYVERLVMPTVIDPLRDEWRDVQAAAAALENDGKHDKAVQEIREFHRRLCEIRVLDPACGSGNFLYVTLEHMKRLEGEVLGTLADLGAGQNLLEMQGNTVDPHQFLGIELNPRAAAIAEMVLWIGYLQWHFRTHGHINPPQPVLRAFENIECRDAVLAYDRIEYKLDETGKPVTQWDGKTYKKSPTTGEDIPDESAQVPIEVYVNPRKAEWPKADYVVGNPPFIGNKRMRSALGDGYVEALRSSWKNEVPDSADFVMYWWRLAADLVKAADIMRFGLITTNGIRQSFNRRVVANFLSDSKVPLSVVFAIPDHPWVDSADGAAVRISMTVVERSESSGQLLVSANEAPGESGEVLITFSTQTGRIFEDLRTGANVPSAKALRSNAGLASRGVTLVGQGFILDEEGKGRVTDAGAHLKPYLSGRQLSQGGEAKLVLDFYGVPEERVREEHPEAYQWLLERVLPERRQNNRVSYREKWWTFAEPRSGFRNASSELNSIIVTPRTAKHRFFDLVPQNTQFESEVVGIAHEDVFVLGVLSSLAHQIWVNANAASFGSYVGNIRYNQTRCFDPFPFPESEISSELVDLVRSSTKGILDLRRERIGARAGPSFTDLYNVLEKLRREERLTDKEQQIHEQGLVSVLRELHDDLDRAVFAAYGWEDLGEKLVGRPGATTPWPEKPDDQAEAEEELLQRLVDLNHERAAEEARGLVRWLRPEYQAPDEAPEQARIDAGDEDQAAAPETVAPTRKLAWPKTLQARVRAVRDQLTTAPMDPTTLAARYKRKPEKSVSQVLEALSELGMVRAEEDGRYRLRE